MTSGSYFREMGGGHLEPKRLQSAQWRERGTNPAYCRMREHASKRRRVSGLPRRPPEDKKRDGLPDILRNDDVSRAYAACCAPPLRRPCLTSDNGEYVNQTGVILTPGLTDNPLRGKALFQNRLFLLRCASWSSLRYTGRPGVRPGRHAESSRSGRACTRAATLREERPACCPVVSPVRKMTRWRRAGYCRARMA